LPRRQEAEERAAGAQADRAQEMGERESGGKNSKSRKVSQDSHKESQDSITRDSKDKRRAQATGYV